jgi:hypothetical protein
MDELLVILAVQTLKVDVRPEVQTACWLIIQKRNRTLSPHMYHEPGDPYLREWYGPECWRD